MRIALIINDLGGGGAEKVVLLLSSHLVAAGHQVLIVTMQRGNDAYVTPAGTERATLRTAGLNRGVGKILLLPAQGVEIARTLRAWQPDVCMSNLPRSNVAHVLSRFAGNAAPILLAEHAAPDVAYAEGTASHVMRRLVSAFYPRADGVVAVSSGVRDALLQFGVPPGRLHVISNPVAVTEVQARAQEAAPGVEILGDDMPSVITVGRHAPEKDHSSLLRAFAIARRRAPARLVLVGQGPLRDKLEQEARGLGIAKWVVFAGWQANPFAWMARSDLFVLTSRFEGFGNVLVEAMACGLPVISTDAPGGPREILRGGRDGILVPVGDVEALAEALVEVLCDERRRAQLAAASRLRAPDFDLPVIGRRYADLFAAHARSAVAGHRAP